MGTSLSILSLVGPQPPACIRAGSGLGLRPAAAVPPMIKWDELSRSAGRAPKDGLPCDSMGIQSPGAEPAQLLKRGCGRSEQRRAGSRLHSRGARHAGGRVGRPALASHRAASASAGAPGASLAHQGFANIRWSGSQALAHEESACRGWLWPRPPCDRCGPGSRSTTTMVPCLHCGH